MANYEKNLSLLKEKLEGSETIKASVFGTYEGKLMGKETLRNGVLVVTEKRVVFFAKLLFGFELESFPFKNISSIEHSKQFMGYSITIHASGNDVKIKWIQKGEVEEFMELVNSNIVNGIQETSLPVQSEVGITDQIKKLSELFQQGILTEEEFSTKKRQLLDKM